MKIDDEAALHIPELRKRMKGWRNYFPNTSTIAEFHSHSQTIHIHDVDRETFAALVKEENKTAVRQHLQVMMHETTHWADLIGTVWGRERLVEIYNALNVGGQKAEGSESDYWRLIALHDEDRRISYPQYYKVVESGATGDSRFPWKIGYSCGIEFDTHGRQDVTRPIFFITFADPRSDRRVARQPLSVSALLETSAVWSEMATGFEILAGINDGTEKIDAALWRRQSLEAAYNAELTEYSGPAHMLSELTQTQDIALTYEVAAAMSFLVLNLQAEWALGMRTMNFLPACR